MWLATPPPYSCRLYSRALQSEIFIILFYGVASQLYCAAPEVLQPILFADTPSVITFRPIKLITSSTQQPNDEFEVSEKCPRLYPREEDTEEYAKSPTAEHLNGCHTKQTT
jgi:hypothetical protein